MSLKKCEVICYVDNIEECIDNLNKDYLIKKFAYILHDKDTIQENEIEVPKKIHYHLLLWFEDEMRPSTIAKYFNVDYRLVKKIQSENGALAYLIHFNNKDKYQYSPYDVITFNFDYIDFISNLDTFIENNETIILNQILIYIDAFKPNYKQLLKFCIENKILSTYLRYYRIIADILKNN